MVPSPAARVTKRSRRLYVASARHRPVLVVSSGERVIIDTDHAYEGRVPRDGQTLSPNFFRRVLPLAGPVGVDGAEPRQWLAVTVESIKTRGEGTLVLRRGKGLLGRYQTGPPKAFSFGVDGDTATHPTLGRFSIAPMIGAVAVAPAGGSVPSIIAGVHGGNLDCPEMRAGATMVLPVLTRKALLYLGDGHAIMGHGELGGTGIEIALTVGARLDLVSGPPLRSDDLTCPLLIDGSPWLAAIGRGKTLDLAARRAVHGLRVWLRHLSCDQRDARIALQGEARVCQIVNNLVTVAVGITPHPDLADHVARWLGQG